jgi:gamma-glutamylcyclotransferase (GGCT)/AIG2-like uncharacterized protein YtfP
VNLFLYGTLMCSDIMEDVPGSRLPHVPGTLKGFSRRAAKGASYPAIVPDGKGRVHGIVYRDVPGPAWDRLDRFEGEMYARRPVEIRLTDGAPLPAETYAVRPAFLDRLEASGWDLNDFIRNSRAIFRETTTMVI